MHPPIDESPPLENSIALAAAVLASIKKLVVLTGAGISAESGIATFRASDGLWENHRVEDVATPEAFRRDPDLVWRFYNQRRANVAKAAPNPGHRAIAALEQRLGEGFTLVTQNVDGLHQAAGNSRVLELHGSLRRTRCLGCGIVADRGLEPLDDLPHCDACGAMLRPAIVWFHEMLPEDVWQEAVSAVQDCECLMVVGTSAVVYPAASLIPLARQNEASIIEVNLTRTEASRHAGIRLQGPAGELLPQVLERLT